MYKVIFNGSVMLLQNTPENRDIIQNLLDESKEKCLRFEIRYKRMRQIFYFDYDKPKEDGKVSESVAQ